jgi:hypothetical protein
VSDRTPVHVFGEALAPDQRGHAADFDECLSWPHCACIRLCATSPDTAPRFGAMFWVALAIGCVLPVLFSAALLSIAFFPDIWSSLR